MKKLLLILFIIGCGSTPTHQYSDRIVNGYMTSCMFEIGDRGFCECTIDGFQDRMPEEDFIEMGLAISEGGQLPSVALNVMSECQ